MLKLSMVSGPPEPRVIEIVPMLPPALATPTSTGVGPRVMLIPSMEYGPDAPALKVRTTAVTEVGTVILTLA